MDMSYTACSVALDLTDEGFVALMVHGAHPHEDESLRWRDLDRGVAARRRAVGS